MGILPKDEWLLRFSGRLLRMRDRRRRRRAMSIAFATYADANDLTPEEAAEIYAMETVPSELGAPE